jgi:N-acetylglucosaminyldiphosphoundecaprenol N-acetyl-beta-D-mannosaminyltransferase
LPRPVTPALTSMSVEIAKLFGIGLHRITMKQTIALLLEWMGENQPCRYVVTPNVDHVVKLQSHTEMQAAYQDAALIVADGWPLVTASRWLGRPLP